MLVFIDPESEKNRLLSIRKSKEYDQKSFYSSYRKKMSEIDNVVEAAKIYILDNYKKVKDWSNLQVEIRDGKTGKEHWYGKQSKTANKSSIVSRLLHEIEERKEEIKSVEKCIYDCSDGDFSVTINGKELLWIDSYAIVTIASYVEKELSKNV